MDDRHVARAAGRLACAAGELIRRLRTDGPVRAAMKRGHELVTEADLRSEELIRTAIRTEFPTHRMVSEESWDGWKDDLFAGPVWIVDPLDGTVNYAHGHPYVSVSVAFAVDGVVLAGAVYGPFLGQLFQAVRGRGATLNGRPISVAAPSSLREALVGTGFPHDRSDLDGPMDRLRRLLAGCRDVRRTGSPALDIASVGAGFLDAHTESLAPWDVAAAGLVATEAGARRGNLLPEPFPVQGDLAGTGFVVAAPSIYPQLVELLSAG